MYSIFCQTYANVGILFQTGKHLRSILPLFVVQSVFLHFSVQRRRINVQHLRRPFPVARAYFQGPDDGLFFLCLIFRKKEDFLFLILDSYVQTSRFDYRLFGQQDGSFDLVLQFPASRMRAAVALPHG